MVDLIPSLYVKIDNGGLVIRSAENTTAISPDDLHREVERARMNAQFYTERLVAYLMQHGSLFAEYNSNTADEMNPITSTYDQNGMSISGGAATELKKYLYS